MMMGPRISTPYLEARNCPRLVANCAGLNQVEMLQRTASPETPARSAIIFIYVRTLSAVAETCERRSHSMFVPTTAKTCALLALSAVVLATGQAPLSQTNILESRDYRTGLIAVFRQAPTVAFWSVSHTLAPSGLNIKYDPGGAVTDTNDTVSLGITAN